MAFVTNPTLFHAASSQTHAARHAVCVRSSFRGDAVPVFMLSPVARSCVTVMHGHGHGHGHGQAAGGGAATTERRRPGEHKGFVEEMRFVAMRLHTKDQAPREGEQEASALPIDAWYPKQADFMQFLVDSRCVYDYFENDLVPNGAMFSPFVNTGLERLASLDEDIKDLNENHGVSIPPPTPAATNYVAYLRGLLDEKPESVLCHWYNYYFAHSAGGKMIGRLMQDRLFGGKQFAFYKWEGDVKEHLNKVRVVIDDVAKEWPRDVKDECLKETSLAFGYSGTVLQNLAKAAE